MLSKSATKLINSLKKKKFRQKYNNFLAEGEKIAHEILSQPNCKIHSIYATPDCLSEYSRKIADIRCNIIEISEKELKTISSLTTPNKILMVVEIPERKLEDTSLDGLSLVLDDIQDPGNLGTIWRIADWFGIERVICSRNSVDPYNAKVIQASMGAFLRVPIFETDLATFLPKIDIPVYGTLLAGDNVFETKLSANGLIVIGNESKGINENLLPYIDRKIKIPAHGGAESLNAAVATGIICALFKNN